MMRGTGFAELYFSPQMFDRERYAAAAEVLNWAEENFDILRNSVFSATRRRAEVCTDTMLMKRAKEYLQCVIQAVRRRRIHSIMRL